MKSVSDLLHRTPWWVLLFGGAAIFAALAVFVTPYHIIQYRDDGRTSAESRAIKREIDNTFAENAISVGRNVVRGMLSRTTDPARRAELEQALAGLEEARRELREVTTEAVVQKRQALEAAREAEREVRNTVREAQRALRSKDAAPEEAAHVRALEAALRQAEQTRRDAERQLRRAERGARISIATGQGEGPAFEVQVEGAQPPKAPDVPAPPAAEGVPTPPDFVLPPLAPETAQKIRRNVTGDMYRMGIGAALILILIPLFIVAIVVKFFADRSRASQKVAEAKRREAEYHRMAQQVTEAKLSALQAQVEPHFLYNTLASVQALTEVDPPRASEMTGHLIQYLRNALPKMRDSVSTVGQEIELARAYLNILQMRMGKRLAFEIDVPAELMDKPFPPLMLPSLVENSIKHGLEPQREGGLVRISAAVVDGRLRLVVADTGRGFSETPGAGVGLANIRERLAALYGQTARLTLEANEPHGVVATIDVPEQGARAAAAAAAAAPAAAAKSVPVEPAPLTPAMPPPIPASAATASAAPAAATGATARSEFWAKTWSLLGTLERIWRMSLYYLFLGLVAVLAIACIAAVVGVAVGALPVQVENEMFSGPVGILIGLAAGVIAFVVGSAALAIALVVVYGLGFFVAGLLVFVVLAVLLGLSPILAPIILLGLGIWWMARRHKAAQPAAPVQRVEPTIADTGR